MKKKNVFALAQSNRGFWSNFPGGHVEEDGAEIKNDDGSGLCCRHVVLKMIIGSPGRARGERAEEWTEHTWSVNRTPAWEAALLSGDLPLFLYWFPPRRGRCFEFTINLMTVLWNNNASLLSCLSSLTDSLDSSEKDPESASVTITWRSIEYVPWRQSRVSDRRSCVRSGLPSPFQLPSTTGLETYAHTLEINATKRATGRMWNQGRPGVEQMEGSSLWF